MPKALEILCSIFHPFSCFGDQTNSQDNSISLDIFRSTRNWQNKARAVLHICPHYGSSALTGCSPIGHYIAGSIKKLDWNQWGKKHSEYLYKYIIRISKSNSNVCVGRNFKWFCSIKRMWRQKQHDWGHVCLDSHVSRWINTKPWSSTHSLNLAFQNPHGGGKTLTMTSLQKAMDDVKVTTTPWFLFSIPYRIPPWKCDTQFMTYCLRKAALCLAE